MSLSIREGSLEQVACELDPDRQVLRRQEEEGKPAEGALSPGHEKKVDST